MSPRRTHVHPHSPRARRAARRSARTKRGGMIGAILLIVVIVAVVYFFNQGKPAGALPLEVSASQAYEYYQTGEYYFVDVREQEEWDNFHIPDIALIPLTELPDRLSEIPTDKPIVVVCNSGNRSQSGRDTLLQAGFTNVTSMAGGSQEWSALGYPIEGTRP